MDKVTELRCQALGLEAMNFKASVKAVKDLLPNFIDSVNNFFTSLAITPQQPVGLINGTKLDKILKDVNYADIRKLEVVGPRGIKGTYLDYLEAIEASVVFAEKLMPDILNPFANWVMLLLSTPESLKSVQGSKVIPQDIRTRITLAQKILEKEFEPHSHQQSYQYSRLVTRNKDWSLVVGRTNDLVSRYMNTKYKEVMLKVTDLVEALNKLLQRIEEDPDTYQLSGVTIASLAEQAFAVGKAVEYYSIVGTMVKELSVSVEETVGFLEKNIG